MFNKVIFTFLFISLVESDWCPIVKPYDESHFIINYKPCENGLEQNHQDNVKIKIDLSYQKVDVVYAEVDQNGIQICFWTFLISSLVEVS